MGVGKGLLSNCLMYHQREVVCVYDDFVGPRDEILGIVCDLILIIIIMIMDILITAIQDD